MTVYCGDRHRAPNPMIAQPLRCSCRDDGDGGVTTVDCAMHGIFGMIPAAPGEPVADDTPYAEGGLLAENARLREEVRRLHAEIEAIGDNNASAYATARDVRAENERLNQTLLAQVFDETTHVTELCEKIRCLRAANAGLECALFSIDYALGPPNAQRVSLYDVDRDEERVVRAVERTHLNLEQCHAALRLALDQVRQGYGDEELEKLAQDAPLHDWGIALVLYATIKATRVNDA